jgi:hypothetical protein
MVRATGFSPALTSGKQNAKSANSAADASAVRDLQNCRGCDSDQGSHFRSGGWLDTTRGRVAAADFEAPFAANEVRAVHERVPIFKGRLNQNGWTATSYAWFVWEKLGIVSTALRLVWIAGCRKALEWNGDYR